MQKTEQRQQCKPCLDPAFAARQQHLQTSPEQQREQREEFDLGEEIEQRPCPGVAGGDIAIPGGVQISRLRKPKGGNVEQKDAEYRQAAYRVEGDISRHPVS